MIDATDDSFSLAGLLGIAVLTILTAFAIGSLVGIAIFALVYVVVFVVRTVSYLRRRWALDRRIAVAKAALPPSSPRASPVHPRLVFARAL